MARSRAQARAERSRATRARIVAAATPLFVEHGYLETTMGELAGAAGVAVQTLYLSFGSKVAVLEAALDAVAGSAPDPGPADGGRREAGRPTDSEPGPAAPSGPAMLAGYVRAGAARIEREYPLAAVLRAAAADPEPAELLARTRHAALARHARAVDELAEQPGFDERISLQRATDVVATLLSPEAYGLLVVGHGWPTPDWVDWTARHLQLDLFAAGMLDP